MERVQQDVLYLKYEVLQTGRREFADNADPGDGYPGADGDQP
jgi:hypothetical protein